MVVLDRHEEAAERYALDVALPAGLASDARHVYAAVNSVAPAEGLAAEPQNPLGALGGGSVWELDFSEAYRVEPAVALQQ